MHPFSLVVATTNPGKLREIRRALDGTAVTILSLQDFPPVREPEETGATFAENARAKAAYYSEHTGRDTVTEDSGLVIDAIGGRPGVESARYPGATYPEKFANLYRELALHAPPWTARFVCSVALVKGADGTTVFTCEATVEGEIAPDPRGAHGFGYDPIFFYPPYGRTLGDVTDEEKLLVSHRGKAFAQLREWINLQFEV